MRLDGEELIPEEIQTKQPVDRSRGRKRVTENRKAHARRVKRNDLAKDEVSR